MSSNSDLPLLPPLTFSRSYSLHLSGNSWLITSAKSAVNLANNEEGNNSYQTDLHAPQATATGCRFGAKISNWKENAWLFLVLSSYCWRLSFNYSTSAILPAGINVVLREQYSVSLVSLAKRHWEDISLNGLLDGDGWSKPKLGDIWFPISFNMTHPKTWGMFFEVGLS